MSYSKIPLGKLGHISQGISLARYRDTKSNSYTKRVINISNLNSYYVSGEIDEVPLKPDLKNKFEQYCLEKNDLVIAIKGAHFKSSIITEETQNSLAGPNIAFVRLFTERIHPRYVLVLLKSQWMNNAITVLYNSSSIIPSIKISELRKLEIPILEPELQKKIAELFFISEELNKIDLKVLELRQQLVEHKLFSILGEP